MSTKTAQAPSQTKAPHRTRDTDLAELRAHCQHCDMHPVCHPPSLNLDEVAALDHWFPKRRRVQRGETLYNVNDPFTSIYAVRSGFFKTLMPGDMQRDCITGFQMTGDVLGMDGIGTGSHACHAVALEVSEVCLVPYDTTTGSDELARALPTLHSHLNRLLSQHLVQNQTAFQTLVNTRAEARLAAFILDLGQRYAKLGYSSHSFVLRMTRKEIGSYLGLSLETVSRLFSQFQESGLLDVQTRHLHITQPAALADVAAGRTAH